MTTLLDTTTLSSELYCTTTLANEIGIDDDSLSTTIVCLSTTATCGSSHPQNVSLQQSIAYVESLSNEELETLDMMLVEKELSLENVERVALEIDLPKTYQKK